MRSVRAERDSRESREASGVLDLQRLMVLAQVFIAGASVMLIEIVGTRVIAPVFGVSLFVWSALLTVTLAALAGGYVVGGRLADRSPTRGLLCWVMTVAGLLACTVPVARLPVLSGFHGFGLRLGPLMSATCLFGPTVLVLGAVGPVAVRLTLGDVQRSGRSVGAIFGFSTVGSLAGTLLTALVLIPAFEVDQIVIGVSILLVVAGVAPMAARRPVAAVVLVLAPTMAVFAPARKVPEGYAIVARAQSQQGLVEVIDDHREGVRLLRVDHSIVGAELIAERTAAFSFIHMLEAVRFLRPGSSRVLQLGLGTGTLVKALASHGVDTDVVEIDPIVSRFAAAHFALPRSTMVFVEDARTLLASTKTRYPIIIHDTFTGGATPSHLLTREFLVGLRSVLTPEGLVALNFVGATSGDGYAATAMVWRTLQAVFRHVRAFADNSGGPPGSITNVVFFATQGPLDFKVPAGARFEHERCEEVIRSLPSIELQLTADGDRRIITDSSNPLARLELKIAEEHARAMDAFLPLDVWLN